MPPQPESSVIIVACYPEDYCASQLAHAVEDSDAHLINLNVTNQRLADGRITIELRTNRSHAGSTARSLERYGYEVINGYEGSGKPGEMPGNFDNDLRQRAAEILHIINI